MPFNYAAQQLRADRMIARYGAPAKLRRGTVDRACTAVEIAYTPSERRALTNPTNRRVLVSALNQTTPIDRELDKLVMNDPTTGLERELRIVDPPGRLSPSSAVIVFWDLTVRG